MTFEAWLLFVAIWFAAGVPLGPNAANCIAISASQGLGRALWAVAGVLAAGVVFIVAVILGLGAVLAANALLFSAIKLAGAAYLVWMGAKLILNPATRIDASATPARGRRVLTRAMLISFSNPKALLAYGAIFSQFVTPEAAFASQLAVIVPSALVINAVIYTGYALLGRGVQRFLGTAARMARFNRGIGGFYIFAGVALASNEISDLRRRGVA